MSHVSAHGHLPDRARDGAPTGTGVGTLNYVSDHGHLLDRAISRAPVRTEASTLSHVSDHEHVLDRPRRESSGHRGGHRRAAGSGCRHSKGSHLRVECRRSCPRFRAIRSDPLDLTLPSVASFNSRVCGACVAPRSCVPPSGSAAGGSTTPYWGLGLNTCYLGARSTLPAQIFRNQEMRRVALLHLSTRVNKT